MVHHALGTRSRLATALLIASFVSLPTLLQAGNAPVKRNVDASHSKLHGTPLADRNGRVQVFVRLAEPAVAELNAES